MASVWISQPTGDTKLDGHLNPIGAQAALASRAKTWVRAKLGRKLKTVSEIEIHLFENGKPTAHLFIEPCSPPTLPAGGDRYRDKKAA